ncbi:MAG: alanyl-tRNA editing protein [Anaerolineales bacterium]|nr:alanyl-tRNA editing protein [Anaerolineales bacterium]
MPTQLLYLQDAYLLSFESSVVEATADTVVLEATAFYPGGGGQPSDRGWLRFEDGARRPVSQVVKDGSRVLHTLEAGSAQPGSRVTGELDWERRYALMRTHTAMHILCGVIWKRYGASVTGGNMEPLKGRMDFEFESMRQEFVREIEVLINEEVAHARPVTTAILPRSEAFKIPDLIRTKVNLLPPGIAEVRVVEIVGLDLQADGGTHVRNTREVGPLRITDYKSKGAINKRLVVSLEAEVPHV